VKRVVQSVNGGPVLVAECPVPVISSTEVLVETRASLISAGTERSVSELAQSNLLAKARARPDLVRQLYAKAGRDGIRDTLDAVRHRLAEDLPLGYSAAGVVTEVGASVTGIARGSLVATGSAGIRLSRAFSVALCRIQYPTRRRRLPQLAP
jgi:NADPH:quinone reductase-like Zn-dependent oxidoreductase